MTGWLRFFWNLLSPCTRYNYYLEKILDSILLDAHYRTVLYYGSVLLLVMGCDTVLVGGVKNEESNIELQYSNNHLLYAATNIT